jgi:hypothetical protein
MPTIFALFLASFVIDKPKFWLTMILVGHVLEPNETGSLLTLSKKTRLFVISFPRGNDS